MRVLKKAEDDDIIILSDVDEIDLNKLNLFNKKLSSLFTKDVYVQINLLNLDESGYGSKICLKKF